MHARTHARTQTTRLHPQSRALARTLLRRSRHATNLRTASLTNVRWRAAGLTNTLFEFDPKGPAWRTLDPGSSGPFFPEPDDNLPNRRALFGIVGVAGGLYVFGGRRPRSLVGTMENGALDRVSDRRRGGEGKGGWWENGSVSL